MGDPVPLHTTRFLLTAPRASDAEPIYLACQDEAIQHFTTVPSPYTREDAEKFIELTAGWWRDGTSMTWVVRPLDAPEGVIGVIGLDSIADGAAELGFWAAPGARGTGAIAEAAAAVLDFAFGPMRLERVQWQAAVGNSASARVAQKLGFRFEGVRRLGLGGIGAGSGRGRADGWVAGLLATDERAAVDWGSADAPAFATAG
ncbi:GNAT family N-acetyltransferase [Microbacterium halophytorum]|uniref:GNAT family N-acetyltransferase n=1 Tax=Microbacterium halophytorum TaxID=2067568 RepID=UPI000CFC3EC0|nr:GNAT family N-acetyltransferase [Microbacterium halophytorum]